MSTRPGSASPQARADDLRRDVRDIVDRARDAGATDHGILSAVAEALTGEVGGYRSRYAVRHWLFSLDAARSAEVGRLREMEHQRAAVMATGDLP